MAFLLKKQGALRLDAAMLVFPRGGMLITSGIGLVSAVSWTCELDVGNPDIGIPPPAWA